MGRRLHRVIVLASILCVAAAGTAHAIDNTEPMARPLLPKVRAMGDAFTAVADDENAIYYNPAGYAIIDKGIISVFSLGLKINVDESALDFYKALLSGEDVTTQENINNFLSDVTIAPSVAGPIQFGRVGNGLGFAFYDNLNVRLSTRPAGVTSEAEWDSYFDLGFIGGFATPLPIDGLYAGVNLKVILRMKSMIEGTVVDIVSTVEDLDELPIGKSIGFGSDIGLLYQAAPWLNFGLTGLDVFGTRFSDWETLSGSSSDFPDSSIKPRLAFGTAIYPLVLLGGEGRHSDALVFAVDYTDLLDFSPLWSNLNFGVRWHTLKIVDLRGGFDGGYLAWGVGLDLKVVELGLSYFVDELGTYPGSRPVQNMMLEVGMRW